MKFKKIVAYFHSFLRVIIQMTTKIAAIIGNIFIGTPGLGKAKNPIAQFSER
jgi:hypothetical protein